MVSMYIRLSNIPPWSDLNHFQLLSSTGQFADGTKFEDLAKVRRHLSISSINKSKPGAYHYSDNDQVIIFASVHVFTPEFSPRGYLLLRLIRVYLELDMCAALTTHTETTLEAGEAELRNFEALIKVFNFFPLLTAFYYIELTI